MTQSDRRSGFMSNIWVDRPLATAGVAFIGIVAAAAMACSQGLRPIASGDEPPIRVKNGSVELQLLHKTHEWQSVNASDRKNWKIKDEPARNNDDYEVIVAPSNQSSCSNGVLVATGNPVELTTTGGKIEIKSTGRKTKIKSDPDLQGIRADVEGGRWRTYHKDRGRQPLV